MTGENQIDQHIPCRGETDIGDRHPEDEILSDLDIADRISFPIDKLFLHIDHGQHLVAAVGILDFDDDSAEIALLFGKIFCFPIRQCLVVAVKESPLIDRESPLLRNPVFDIRQSDYRIILDFIDRYDQLIVLEFGFQILTGITEGIHILQCHVFRQIQNNSRLFDIGGFFIDDFKGEMPLISHLQYIHIRLQPHIDIGLEALGVRIDLVVGLPLPDQIQPVILTEIHEVDRRTAIQIEIFGLRFVLGSEFGKDSDEIVLFVLYPEIKKEWIEKERQILMLFVQKHHFGEPRGEGELPLGVDHAVAHKLPTDIVLP